MTTFGAGDGCMGTEGRILEQRPAIGISRRAHRNARRLLRAARLVSHTLLGAFITLTALGRLVRQRRHDAVVRWWVRGILRILDVRVEIQGRICAEPALFAVNHVSWLDIPCLRLVLDAEFVAKQEVARWPVIGRMAECAGTLFLNRGERDASLTAANNMTRALAGGRNVIVFPEGTTGDGRHLGRFHARLYQAAIRSRRPVQAVAIGYPHPEGIHPAAPFVGDDNLGRHLWALLAEDKLTVRLTFCTPVENISDRRQLAELTRNQVADALGLPTPARALPATRVTGTAAV